MQIAIVGAPGTGKSTLTNKMIYSGINETLRRDYELIEGRGTGCYIEIQAESDINEEQLIQGFAGVHLYVNH